MKIKSLPYQIVATSLVLGSKNERQVTIHFHRTLRIPDNDQDKSYPLPPSLGHFPLKRAKDYESKVPDKWIEEDAVFLPIYQREAMWVSFSTATPAVVKLGVGKVNCITGKEWCYSLGEPQDYMVLPDQPWLDGINDGHGKIKQFVAMPLGKGFTVEGQVTGKEDVGGMQLVMMTPKEKHRANLRRQPPIGDDMLSCESNGSCNIFGYSLAPPPPPPLACSSAPPPPPCPSSAMRDQCAPPPPPKSMLKKKKKSAARKKKRDVSELGLAAGGKMVQKIYPDGHGIDYWDQTRMAKVFIHFVGPEEFEAITGEKVKTRVDKDAYKQHHYPWFELYDEHQGTVQQSDILSKVKSIGQLDGKKDEPHIVTNIHEIGIPQPFPKR